VRKVVTSTIDRIKQSGQLDECPISLKELSLIQEAFVQVLTGIYHRRVEYPRRIFKKGKDRDRAIRLAK